MFSKLLAVFIAVQSVCFAQAQKNLVLVGGGLSDNNAQIWDKMIELAGGVDNAVIGVVTAASSDPEDSASYYDDMFRQYGASDVYWIPVHEANKDANSDPQVVARIRQMTGFFFGGGNQLRIIESFYNDNRVESPALAAIRETYEGGAVVGGTSAGAACMNSAVMVTGGLSYEALLRGAYPIGEETDIDDLTYEPEGGIGFINDVIVDTHFSERGREGRLMRLISDTKDLSPPFGTTFGLGVDEDTALVITDVDTTQAVGEVIGESGVFFASLIESRPDTESDNWGIVDVSTHFLTQGDVINMATKEVTFAAWKSNMKGQEAYNKAVTSNDIFNGNRDNPLQTPVYTNVATELFDSQQSTNTYGLTYELTPRFRVTFIKDTTSVGFGGTNPRTGDFDIAYYNLRIQMEEGLACLTSSSRRQSSAP